MLQITELKKLIPTKTKKVLSNFIILYISNDMSFMVKEYDFLVIGSGIAGMSYALKVADQGSVALICKTELEEANTFYAQGGIASVTNLKVDDFDKHIQDTLIAGDWLNNAEAVARVVRGAPSQIEALVNWGVQFDKDKQGEIGRASCRERV